MILYTGVDHPQLSTSAGIETRGKRPPGYHFMKSIRLHAYQGVEWTIVGNLLREQTLQQCVWIHATGLLLVGADDL